MKENLRATERAMHNNIHIAEAMNIKLDEELPEPEYFLPVLEQAVKGAAAGAGSRKSLFTNPEELVGSMFEAEMCRYASEKKLGIPVPRICMFSVTWECNLDCVGCYAREYEGKGGLTLEDIENAVRQCCEMGTRMFIIVGGEPLMVEGLIDMLGGVEDGLFFLFTNGTLLDAAVADAIAQTENIMPVVSLEGDYDLTDLRRGGGMGRTVADAMKLLADREIPMAISAVVTRKNCSLVISRKWFDRIWNDGVRFAFLIDYVQFQDHRGDDLELTQEDIEVKAKAVQQRRSEARPLVVNFPADEYIWNDTCQAAGIGFMHINADGWVEPCPFSHFAADNIREKSIADILSSPFLEAVRSEIPCLKHNSGGCILHDNEGRIAEIASESGAFATTKSH